MFLLLFRDISKNEIGVSRTCNSIKVLDGNIYVVTQNAIQFPLFPGPNNP